jgi:hypothetical protein
VYSFLSAGLEVTQGEQRCSFSHCLTPTLDGDQWLAPRPGRFNPGKEPPYPWIWDSGGLTAGLSISDGIRQNKGTRRQKQLEGRTYSLTYTNVQCCRYTALCDLASTWNTKLCGVLQWQGYGVDDRKIMVPSSAHVDKFLFTSASGAYPAFNQYWGHLPRDTATEA